HSVLLTTRPPPSSTLFPYTTLFRSDLRVLVDDLRDQAGIPVERVPFPDVRLGLAGAPRMVGDHAVDLALVAEHRVELDRFQDRRSEEHTSELQSRSDLVCRLLLEKK